MSNQETAAGTTTERLSWRHRLAVLGVAVVVIGVIAIVFLVIRDADAPSSGAPADRTAVEATYTQFANAVPSSDTAAAGICAGRSEAESAMAQAASKLGGIGTAGSSINVNVRSVTVTGDVAEVDGSLNTMGTDIDLPLELRRINGAWCVWG